MLKFFSPALEFIFKYRKKGAARKKQQQKKHIL
jgi:hypothetical protein